MRINPFTYLFCLCILLPAGLSAQLPQGDRILAWQVDMAENNNYDSAYSYAQDACMESVHQFFSWSSMEPDTSNPYDANFIANFLVVSNIYHPAFGTAVELQIAPVNTVTTELPTELNGLGFDHPLVIRRFKRLLDTVFAYIPNIELAALNIGNESDIYFGTDASQYAAFKTFLDSVAPHAKQLYFNLHGTDLKMGTTFTLDGLTDAATAPLCQSVNATRDIVATTYYPLNSDFTMQSPAVVAGHFGTLVNLYPDTTRPIYFAECGYSSSPVCNSSEALQAQFYAEVFSAWDTYAASIKYMTVFKTTDWSQPEVDTFAVYYGISDTTFLEYLRALGVRTWPNDGMDKLAYQQILCELNARNWCGTACSLVGVGPEIEQDAGTFFPNPLTDVSVLRFPQAETTVRIWDMAGRMVREYPRVRTGQVRVQRAGLAPGVYMYELAAGKQQHRVGKIMVR